MTDWNRHHGVGATLLENWVEERAVGDLIIQERSDISKLSRFGHKDILTHSGQPPAPMRSTHSDAYSALSRPDAAKVNLGKRRQFMEAELLKMALSDPDPTPAINTAKDWVSTTMQDFSHRDESLEKFARPITFWTDFAAKGSGTAICSTSAATLHMQGYPHTATATSESPIAAAAPASVASGVLVGHRAGQVHQHEASVAPIRFGKHPEFSTPIHENKGK
nr:hypothetical protein HK105_006475 [Polyrhizophydium stewartii]